MRPNAKSKMADLRRKFEAGSLSREEVKSRALEIVKESLDVVKFPLHSGESITPDLNSESA